MKKLNSFLIMICFLCICIPVFAFDPEWPIVPSRENPIYGTLGEYRPKSSYSGPHFHGGVDIDGTNGREVVGSADSGIVWEKNREVLPPLAGSGNRYRIVHDDGTITEYFHLNEIGFQKPTPVGTPTIIPHRRDTPVPKNHPLAFLGKTGGRTMPSHLHFGIREAMVTEFIPKYVSTYTPTPTYFPFNEDAFEQKPNIQAMDSPTAGQTYPLTATPTTTSTPTHTPTNTPTRPTLVTDYLNPFDWLAPYPSTPIGENNAIKKILVLPEPASGSRVSVWGRENNPYINQAGIQGGLLIDATAASGEDCRIELIGKCKFVVKAQDKMPNSGVLNVHSIGYYVKDPEKTEWNYKIAFDRIKYDERNFEEGVYRVQSPYQTHLGGTEYWYKLYWEYSPTPVAYNIKETIENGVLNGTIGPPGTYEYTLVFEATRKMPAGTPTPVPSRFEMVVHVRVPAYWVDCENGDDANPGTFEEPFKTITKAFQYSLYGDLIMVKSGICDENSGESIPLNMPDGVVVEGMGYYGFNMGGTVIKSISYPSPPNIIEFEDCSIETRISNVNCVCGLAGIYLEKSSPEITNCRIQANTQCGIFCTKSSSPYIFNNQITNNGGDGIYVCDMDETDPYVQIVNCTISGNSGHGINVYNFSKVILWNSIIAENGGWGIYDAQQSFTHFSSFVCFYGNLMGAYNFGIYPGIGIYHDDPLFTGGPFGSHYLSQTEFDGCTLSPCVNSGSTSPEDIGLANRTTSSDNSLDQFRLDLGFHHEPQALAATQTPEPTATGTFFYTPTEGPWPTSTPYQSPSPIPTPYITGQFFEGFEDDLSQWSWNGLWHVVSDDSEDPFYSEHAEISEGKRAMWYGQNHSSDYDTGSTNSGRLISPTIFLTDDFSLVFDSWEETEGIDYGYDTRKIYISIDNGDSWELLFISGKNDAQYRRVVCNLSGYKGQTVRLKFEFDTVDQQFNNFTGWFIDNVHIDRPIPSVSHIGIMISLICMSLILIKLRTKKH